MPTSEERARSRAHKLARKLYPVLTACEDCGETDGLERHHPDYSQPALIQVLCRACHRRADQRDGYAREKKQKACKVCGVMFWPSHSKKSETCGRSCLSVLGRQNAAKRWAAYYQSGNRPKRVRGRPVNSIPSGPSPETSRDG